ncbi:MAG: SDR family oxidoreductase [Microcystis aeruginosa W11-06]|jgi:3-oxoacyl-[acyl-carrier protein] reductase|uniref:SDR family oxidoreductase n=1 Tax=Microcystis wesenbergii Mw_MB_S_20031200_S109D TaxID=2486241 RepID=A0A552LZ57_9CHRO|nr:SDR family oxidoreductase [Microcystis aeruginosa W11-03]NCR94987.1 SDR family oxidoreductase [Microcystis aeruginosa W11-06]TRV25500.1 MAG: SDR family oxidoreductase [Microcystis wesenbergii Mw_MB_S_20031200_S109D]
MSNQQKVAIVTGGSRGIGRATCLALAGQGFSVVVVGTNPDRIEQTLNLINDKCNPSPAFHLGLALDVRKEADMEEMVNQAVAHFGNIDLLVASAGLGKKVRSDRSLPRPTTELSLDEWHDLLEVNLTGVFLSNRAVLPIMISQASGQIVNICSSTTPYGLRGEPYAPAYCASKFGVVGLTESLAEEVRPYGIRVQAIFPGLVETGMIAKTALARRYGGLLTVEDVAAIIVYLTQQQDDTVIVHPHLLPVLER